MPEQETGLGPEPGITDVRAGPRRQLGECLRGDRAAQRRRSPDHAERTTEPVPARPARVALSVTAPHRVGRGYRDPTPRARAALTPLGITPVPLDLFPDLLRPDVPPGPPVGRSGRV